MKKYLSLILLVFILSNCKKERSCSCTVESSGTKTVRNQTTATTVNLPFPSPVPLPPIVLSPAKDTTSAAPYFHISTFVTTYDNINKKNVKRLCQESYEEAVNENSSIVVPGSYTITTTDQGTKKHSCSIK